MRPEAALRQMKPKEISRRGEKKRKNESYYYKGKC